MGNARTWLPEAYLESLRPPASRSDRLNRLNAGEVLVGMQWETAAEAREAGWIIAKRQNLRWTSLWILLPALQAVLLSPPDWTFALLLLATTYWSMKHWNNFRLGSVAHLMDIVHAFSLVGYLIFKSLLLSAEMTAVCTMHLVILAHHFKNAGDEVHRGRHAAAVAEHNLFRYMAWSLATFVNCAYGRGAILLGAAWGPLALLLLTCCYCWSCCVSLLCEPHDAIDRIEYLLEYVKRGVISTVLVCSAGPVYAQRRLFTVVMMAGVAIAYVCMHRTLQGASHAGALTSHSQMQAPEKSHHQRRCSLGCWGRRPPVRGAPASDLPVLV